MLLHGTANQRRALVVYSKIMNEIKIRIDAISSNVLIAPISPQGRLVHEFCFLQLRMICELIALGCLVAHGDITNNTPLRKLWSADKIMRALERLHPDFYPSPVEDTKDARTRTLKSIKAGFLTKRDLLTLNGKSGDVLHRGTLQKLPTSTSPSERQFADIAEWSRKIRSLLNHHMIALDKDKLLICLMETIGEGKVQVIIAGKIAPL